MKKLPLAVLGVALLSSGTELYAACNNATVVGGWGFTGSGAVFLPTGPVPVAAVGTAQFDPDGNISGSQDRSLGGDSQHETFSGTYSITRSCTLTITTNVYDDAATLQRTTTLKGIVVRNGRQTRMIYQSIILPNGSPLPSVLTLDADRIAVEHGRN